jgi:hypothetical protein
MDAKVMETIAYYIALSTIVCVPPGILLWFLIHPFARLWRRLGPAATYLIATPVLVLASMASANPCLEPVSA